MGYLVATESWGAYGVKNIDWAYHDTLEGAKKDVEQTGGYVVETMELKIVKATHESK